MVNQPYPACTCSNKQLFPGTERLTDAYDVAD